MNYAYGNWFYVIVNIAVFLFFIKSSFRPKTKTDWRTYNTFAAFIVSLFIEMYGFPLTIYLLTAFLGSNFGGIDFSHDAGHLLNSLLGIKGDPHTSIFHILSNVLIVGGLLLISSAWNILYKAQRRGKLAIDGVYRYVRHPQYTGFIAIIAGFLLQWPTIITLIMAPILIMRYIRLANEEEKVMMKRYGDEYLQYKKHTSRFIPSLRSLPAKK